MAVGSPLAKGTLVHLTPPGTEYALQSISHPKDRALLKLAGVDTIETAEALRGAEAAVAREALGAEVLMTDLIGCTLVDAASGREIGIVRDWQKNPGHDLLVLESGMLIPYVEAFFPAIDLKVRRITARLPAGLDEL